MLADKLTVNSALQEKREKCVQYPKRSKTEAEIAAVHQEIEILQNETEQAMHDYEVRPWCCPLKQQATCLSPACGVTVKL